MSEADKHYIVVLHLFDADEYQRDRFFDRIMDEAFRYEDDLVFGEAGPCEEEEGCHDEYFEDDLPGSHVDRWVPRGYCGCRQHGAGGCSSEARGDPGLDDTGREVHPEARGDGGDRVPRHVDATPLSQVLQEGWQMKRLLKAWATAIREAAEAHLYWAEHGKNCSFCRWRWSPELIIDTGHKGWYACPRCWRVIQEMMDYEA